MTTAMEIYEKLHAAYGQPRWWSDDPYTVMVQSILVQNTSWSSVKKVTDALPDSFTPMRAMSMEAETLETLIRPCGFCKGKTATIRRLTQWYGQYGWDVEIVRAMPQERIREELLAVKGIGAETADVILVYAFHKPSFVIDTYTRRLLARLRYAFETDEEIRSFFEQNIPKDYRLYGWFHWLILEHGIKHCKKVPICNQCPFRCLL